MQQAIYKKLKQQRKEHPGKKFLTLPRDTSELFLIKADFLYCPEKPQANCLVELPILLKDLNLFNALPEYHVDLEEVKKVTNFSVEPSKTFEGFLEGIPPTKLSEYITLGNTPNPKFEKIIGDTFRTFGTDSKFREVVPEFSLIRLLIAICNKTKIPYIQGMNTFAGLALYRLPELKAFDFTLALFEKTKRFWTSGTLYGQDLCNKAEQLLEEFYPDKKREVPLLVYGFDVITSLCTCVSNLDGVCIAFEKAFVLEESGVPFGAVRYLYLCAIAQIILLDTKQYFQIGKFRWPRFDFVRTDRVVGEIEAKLPQGYLDEILAGYSTEHITTISSSESEDSGW